jgi:glyoxylate/hydroxypyruvate/2-ketogluconate reductase
MKSKVIVYKKLDKKVLEFIQNTCEVVYFEKLDSQTYPVFLAELKDAQGILGSGLKVDKELLDQAPHLKIVCNTSVGYDNLNMAGQWKSNLEEKWFGVDVHHKVLGIIGMGAIGSVIAKRAHLGFDMEILYHNRSRNEEAEQKYGATYCSMEDLLKQSDFVCLMTPLTPQTEKMMGKREFELMKETAIFINGSRGKTVDEDALIHALQTGEILAAGPDVFVQEPVKLDNPLLSMKNAVTLPHIGSATYETRLKMEILAATNLVAGLQGEIPATLIKSEVKAK